MRRLPVFHIILFLGLCLAHAAADEPKPIPLAQALTIPNVSRLDSVVKAFERGGPGVPFPVFVMETSEINAYADGTKVVFFTGLLDFVDSEGQVAYVLGHELGHNVRRHISKQYAQIGTLVVANAVLSQDYEYQPGRERDVEATQFVQGLTLYMLLTSYSRTHEYDADRQGLAMMVAAGYDPYDAVRFQQKMQQRFGKGDPLAPYLSTHPTSEKRIEQLTHIIEDEYEKDSSGKWRRKAVTPAGPHRMSGKQRLNRGVKMGLTTGGVSLLAGAIEQFQFEGDDIVDARQRNHNIVVATRNGLLLGFLTGYLWAVDVPGSKSPRLTTLPTASPPSPLHFAYNPAAARWEARYTTRF